VAAAGGESAQGVGATSGGFGGREMYHIVLRYKVVRRIAQPFFEGADNVMRVAALYVETN
jgi:hypothetical protein